MSELTRQLLNEQTKYVTGTISGTGSNTLTISDLSNKDNFLIEISNPPNTLTTAHNNCYITIYKINGVSFMLLYRITSSNKTIITQDIVVTNTQGVISTNLSAYIFNSNFIYAYTGW